MYSSQNKTSATDVFSLLMRCQILILRSRSFVDAIPRINTPRENVETPSAFQTSFLEAMLGELGRLSCLETRHGAFSTFRRQILRGGYIAWRILRSRTLEGHTGWSFDPSAEGAMTTACPPLSLINCPCLFLLSTDYCLSPCCHTLRR